MRQTSGEPRKYGLERCINLGGVVLTGRDDLGTRSRDSVKFLPVSSFTFLELKQQIWWHLVYGFSSYFKQFLNKWPVFSSFFLKKSKSCLHILTGIM